ncbi:hypothetical protein D1864_07520 [Oceanobacillus picturae]|nr:hypothetical protein D1864_07520 [Oceanobacillus picturae]
MVKLPDGTEITRRRGRIDGWYVEVDGYGPFDKNYFSDLKALGHKYGNQKVYNDFVVIYDNTEFSVDNTVFSQLIPSIASTYSKEDNLQVLKLFSTLYAVLLAEQNRPLPLKKRVKLLACYQILILNYSVEIACNYSRTVNIHNIVKDVHQLVCTSKKNSNCIDEVKCIYKDKSTSYLLSKICDCYGF